MSEREQEALRLFELALQQMWQNDAAAAIGLYDRAAAIDCSETTRELIAIRKAEALIAAGLDGPEISALPAIVMRRRSPRHVYLAAITLQRRFCETDDRRRAIFYGEVALAAATELGEPMARASVLNHLGVTLVVDSQFKAAITVFEDALSTLAAVPAENENAESLRIALRANLGGAKVLRGDSNDGVQILEGVLGRLDADYDRAEAMLDLCFGYMELGRNDIAEEFGRRALELADIPRQVRNANHLLGELCLRTERYDEADTLFDAVARFYPDFKNVKQLLVAVDLCCVVNWKA